MLVVGFTSIAIVIYVMFMYGLGAYIKSKGVIVPCKTIYRPKKDKTFHELNTPEYIHLHQSKQIKDHRFDHLKREEAFTHLLGLDQDFHGMGSSSTRHDGSGL